MKQPLCIEKCLFRETTSKENWTSYKEYINTYGNNDWFDRAIVDSLPAVFQNNPNRLIIEYIFSLDNLDEVQYKNSVTKYYNYIKEDGEKATLDAFISKFGTPSYLTELSDDTSIALAQDLKLSSQQAISLSNTTSENEELNRRLIREGGKSGSLQFSLMWNNYNDIDLHCIDPNERTNLLWQQVCFQSRRIRC